MSEQDSAGPTDSITPDQGLPWESSLGDFFELAAQKSPDKVFVEISGQEFTYRQAQKKILQNNNKSKTKPQKEVIANEYTKRRSKD